MQNSDVIPVVQDRESFQKWTFNEYDVELIG